MRLFEGSVKEFDGLVTTNSLADILENNYREYYKHGPGQSEIKSWRESLNYLNNAIRFANIDKSSIIIEYELPFTSRRIDALLFGKNETSQDQAVLIELKQWSNDKVHKCDTEGNVVVEYGRFTKEQPHPSLQAEGYHYGLMDFVEVFTDEFKAMGLHSCVYCHNYSTESGERALFDDSFSKAVDSYPIFGKEDVEKLGNYLQKRLSNGEGLNVLNRFTSSHVRPSKKLLDHTGEMINKQRIFTLIDDQIAAYNSIMAHAKKASKQSTRSTIIVKGGPGTGKSVIALEVMGALMRNGQTVFHATGSSAFTNTLRKIVGTRARNVFKFFNSFVTAEADSVDVLVCDEAHRIRETSVNRYTPTAQRSGQPQIDELFNIAKLTIFFIDEYQIVRPNEIGSIELIKEAAKRRDIEAENIKEFELKTQFRCSGSDAYLQWIDNLLEVRPSDIAKFDPKMELRIFDDPHSMMAAVQQRNQEQKNSARIVAGFCWPWSNPNPDGTLVNDVKVDGLEMPWERKDQFWKWATDDSGMDQVGTVYTAQGFEFDYIAVIFGKDLVYRDGIGWVDQPEFSHDTATKRGNSYFATHLKHIYRVLLSRAHKGVYLYFMDEETRRYFESKMNE